MSGSALAKILLAASAAGRPAPGLDEAGQTVAAAASALDGLLLLLAFGSDDKAPPFTKGKGGKSAKGKGAKDSDGDDDGDEDEDEDGGGDGDESGTDKDEDDAAAAARRKKAKAARARKAQMTMLASAARIALSGLSGADAGYDWVAATSVPCTPAELLALSSTAPASPAYADPGYLGAKRYPLDRQHIHAALSYFAQPASRVPYTAPQARAIWGRLRTAARQHGIDTQLVDESLVVLSAAPAEMVDEMPMHHAPFNGAHRHSHPVRKVETTKHFHNNDNDHDRPKGGWGGGSY